MLRRPHPEPSLCWGSQPLLLGSTPLSCSSSPAALAPPGPAIGHLSLLLSPGLPHPQSLAPSLSQCQALPLRHSPSGSSRLPTCPQPPGSGSPPRAGSSCSAVQPTSCRPSADDRASLGESVPPQGCPCAHCPLLPVPSFSPRPPPAASRLPAPLLRSPRPRPSPLSSRADLPGLPGSSVSPVSAAELLKRVISSLLA